MVNIILTNCAKKYDSDAKIMTFYPLDVNYKIKLETEGDFSFNIKTKNKIDIKYAKKNYDSYVEQKYIEANKKVSITGNKNTTKDKIAKIYISNIANINLVSEYNLKKNITPNNKTNNANNTNVSNRNIIRNNRTNNFSESIKKMNFNNVVDVWYIKSNDESNNKKMIEQFRKASITNYKQFPAIKNTQNNNTNIERNKIHYELLKKFCFANAKKNKYLILFDDNCVLQDNFKSAVVDMLDWSETNSLSFYILHLCASDKDNKKNMLNSKINTDDKLIKLPYGMETGTNGLVFSSKTIAHVIISIKEVTDSAKNLYVNVPNKCIPNSTFVSEINAGSNNSLFSNNYAIHVGKKITNQNNINLYDYFKNIGINDSEIFNQNDKNIIWILFNPIVKINSDTKYILINDVWNEKYIPQSKYTIVNSWDIVKNFKTNNEIYKKLLVSNSFEHNKSIATTLKIIQPEDNIIKIDANCFNVLTLSTSIDRLEEFLLANNQCTFNTIEGIKYNPGFVGCGLSYKMIIENASRLKLNHVKICEDDCEFIDYNIIDVGLNYLIAHGFDWDILSCFMVDVNKDLKIYECVELDSKYKLLKINQWTSMVCGIYSSSSYPYFKSYTIDSKIQQKDILSNTIDRKLKFKDIWVIYPFPVELLNSRTEIWYNDKNKGFNNEEYSKMLEGTNEIMNKFIEQYMYQYSYENLLKNHLNNNYDTKIRTQHNVFFNSVILITNNELVAKQFETSLYIDELNENNIFEYVKKYVENNDMMKNKDVIVINSKNAISEYYKYFTSNLIDIMYSNNNEYDMIKLNVFGDVNFFNNCIRNSIGIYSGKDINFSRDKNIDCVFIKKNAIKKVLDSISVEKLKFGYLNRPIFSYDISKLNDNNELAKIIILWNSFYRVTNFWDGVWCFNLGFDIEKRKNMLKYCNMLGCNENNFFLRGHLGLNLPVLQDLIDMGIYSKSSINKKLSVGTIGLNVSQLELFKYISDNNYDYVLILEDDIYFNSNYFLVLDKLFNEQSINTNIDIVTFGHSWFDINSHEKLFDCEFEIYDCSILKPKKNLCQKICMGGLFAVLMSKKAIDVYVSRFNPINNISDILLCDIMFDIKNDFSDNVITKTNYNLNTYAIYSKIKDNKSENVFGLFGMENNKNSLTEENVFNNIFELKNNVLLKYFAKTKKIMFKNNYKCAIKIYATPNTIRWYGKIIEIIAKLFNNVIFIDKYDEDIVPDIVPDIVIFNKLDNIFTCDNNDTIYICINGEKGDILTYCDVGIITTKNFINSYNIYIPQLFTSLWERRDNFKNIVVNTRKNFCAYMYSYDLAYRVELFKCVSKYKKVDALGKSCNKTIKHTDRFVYDNTQTYNDLAVKKYSEYKFVLALENGIADGYITEKLINPIIAGSIPIYAGPLDAFKIINKKRVIYVYDFENHAKMLEYIKLVDSNDDLYNSIVKQDIFAGDLTWNNFELDIKNKLEKAFGFKSRNILLKENSDTNNYYINNYDAILNYDYLDIPQKYINTYFSDFVNEQDVIVPERDYKLDGISHIAWINLDRARDRFLNMSNMLQNISILNTRIKAVDGKNENVRNMILPIKTNITNYEIACTLSHIKALSYLNKLEGEYFMVCEDDITFDNMYLMGNENIKSIIAKAPSFEILLVNKISTYKFQSNYEYYANLNKTLNSNENIYGTGCYIISRVGIQKILNKISHNCETNAFVINDTSIDVADVYLYINAITCVYKYNFVDTQNATSDIHSEHLDYHTKSSTFQLGEIKNNWS